MPSQLIPAVQYLRMSTEHQRYSLEAQAAAIAEYANERGFQVLRTYADAGKSGLTIKDRIGLQRLLSDAISPERDFTAILVLDVSRWGRFQDTDQAAHYEYLCREAGVQVIYSAEPFENDGGMVATIVKHLKRVMAGEYSRELSTKVLRAQIQQARLGFKQGGSRPYGFQRRLITAEGSDRGPLADGEWKALRSDRVLFTHGPPEELAVIRRIFRMFTTRYTSGAEIARVLNGEGVLSQRGKPWSGPQVTALLRNELCIGNYVFNRVSRSMKTPVRHKPAIEWIRVHVLPPLVSEAVFRKAQRLLERGLGRPKFTDTELLRSLRKLLGREGHLSEAIIERAPGVPSGSTYRSRFGTLRRAYDLIGYHPPPERWCMPLKTFWTDDVILDRVRAIHGRHGYVSAALIRADPTLPAVSGVLRHFGTLRRCYELAGLHHNIEEAQRIANHLAQVRRFSRVSLPLGSRGPVQ